MKALFLLAIFMAVPASCLSQGCVANQAPMPASGICTCTEQVVETESCHGGVPGVNCAMDAAMPACGASGGNSCYVYYAATCKKPNVVRAGITIEKLGDLDFSSWNALLPTKHGAATACSTPQEFEAWLQSYLVAKSERAQQVKAHDMIKPKDKDAIRAAL